MTEHATEAPVLDLLKRMTAESIEASTLDEERLMLVRIAALVAVDAPPASYLLNIGAADSDSPPHWGLLGVIAPG